MVSYDELIDPQPELNCTDIEEEDDDSENEYFDPGSKMQRRTEQPSQGQASATDCGAHEESPAPRNCVNKTPFHRSKHKAASFATPEAQLEGTESEEVMEFGGHSESERVAESCEVMINVDSDDEGEDFSRVQKKRRVTKSIGSSFDSDMD